MRLLGHRRASGTGCLGPVGLRDDRAGSGWRRWRGSCEVRPGRRRSVKVGIEAAGHYHRPLLTPRRGRPAGRCWSSTRPCHRAASGAGQAQGQDRRDRPARRSPSWCWPAAAARSRTGPLVLGELAAWSAHRTRRVATRTATKNQLLGQLDRSLPGADAGVARRAGHQGRPAGRGPSSPTRPGWPRWAAPGSSGSPRPAALQIRAAGRRRGWSRPPATRCPPATPRSPAQSWPPTCTLLADLDAQVAAAEATLAGLLPSSPFAPLTSVPGWGVVRAGTTAPRSATRPGWPGHRQVYRAVGLYPMQYESAGKRRDGVDQP